MRNISNKKKILFIVPLPPPYAGPEISSAHLINSPLREQFEIIYVPSNLHHKNSQKGKITINSLATLCFLMIRIIYIIITKNPSVAYMLLSQNVSGFMRDSLLVLISRAFCKKIVLHFHGSNFYNFYKKQPPILKKYIRFILNQTDLVILQAQWLKDVFKKLIPESRLRVVYGGIPIEPFSDKEIEQRSHSRNSVNVLYLSHISVAKGFCLLLKAMQEILSENNAINFIIAGSIIDNERNILFDQEGKNIIFKDIRSEIDAIIKNKKLSGRVRFLGEIADQKQKQQILEMSDIFLLPSYSEGCPLSVLEAMAAGLPVIITPVGTLPEILKDGENGFFIDIGDSDGLRDKINYLAQKPSLRKRIGENNKALIRAKFGIDRTASEIAAVFEQV